MYRCYSALADGTNDYVALEDLNCKQFTPFRRQNEINYETVILIINLFARFHALSFAYRDQHPEDFKKIAVCLEVWNISIMTCNVKISMLYFC